MEVCMVQAGRPLAGCSAAAVTEDALCWAVDFVELADLPAGLVFRDLRPLLDELPADHAGGEICVDGEEILDARWVGPDELPRVPSRASIARRLIDWFVVEYAGASGREEKPQRASHDPQED
jgi:NADH pyrophosphatase NudC (nudix superfamily)